MSQIFHVENNPGLNLNTFQFWTVCKPKSIANTGGLDLLSVYLDRGVIPYSEGGGLVHKPADDLSAYQVVDFGDFVLNNQQAWRGSVGISFYRGIISPAYLVYEIDKTKLDPVFCGYLFRDKACVDKFMQCSMSVGDIQRQIKTQYLRKIEISVPDLEVQRFLGTYLTRETTRIDALISKKTRFIELLREKRQALITHAVTKGLDSNAKMKDSGVEWLGKVPEHWEVQKTWLHFSAKKGQNAAELTKEFCAAIEGDFPVYSGQTENNGVMARINRYEFDAGEDGYLLSTTVGAKAMSIQVVRDKFSLSQNCMAIIPDSNKVLGNFYAYHLIPLFSYERGLIPNHMQPSFRMEDFFNYSVAIPPLSEQMEIIDFLSCKDDGIVNLVTATERSIELLNERRSALITAAVTGQIDLRDGV